MREAYTAETSNAPTQPKPMTETGRTNPNYVGERFYPHGTKLDCVVTDSKGIHGYSGDRADGVLCKVMELLI